MEYVVRAAGAWHGRGMTGGERNALVTGGSRGIGAAIVRRLARDGVRVAFSFATDKTAASAVVGDVESSGGTAIALQADLVEPDAGAELFRRAESELGPLDILVNNAALVDVRPAPLAETSDEDWDRTMAVNARAVFATLREAAQRLRNGGRIVNISTVNTVMPNPGVGVYAASKAAVEQLSAVAARELGDRGITVNAVSPGLTDTTLLRDNNAGIENLDGLAASITPLGRLGQPDDVADVVAMLISNDGRWITGQNLRASGGLP